MPAPDVDAGGRPHDRHISDVGVVSLGWLVLVKKRSGNSGDFNAHLGKNIKAKKATRDGKSLRRGFAALVLFGSIALLVLAILFARLS